MNDDIEQDNSTWTVKFDDGYTGNYNRSQLGRMLNKAHKLDLHRGKQIDHILVSNRWKTGVLDCRPKWAPSIHRSLNGKKSDHALLECKWKWRMRLIKTKPAKDFDVLKVQVDSKGKTTANKDVA